MASDFVRKRDLMENPDPRVPVCLCLDTSGSMQTVEKGGEPTGEYVTTDGKLYRVVKEGETRLEALQKGLEQLYKAIYQDEDARYGAEIAVVTFDDEARKLSDFARVEYNGVPEDAPKLEAKGATSLGAGINLALDLLEARKKEYSKLGVDYHQPWLILMTDGEDNPASGDPSELISARQKILKMVQEKKLCVYPFIIGNEDGIETLRSLSPAQQPLRLEHTEQLKGLFQWLSRSVARVSSGDLNDNQPIPLSAMEVHDWDSMLS